MARRSRPPRLWIVADQAPNATGVFYEAICRKLAGPDAIAHATPSSGTSTFFGRQSSVEGLIVEGLVDEGLAVKKGAVALEAEQHPAGHLGPLR